jgi:hypothetical protein
VPFARLFFIRFTRIIPEFGVFAPPGQLHRAGGAIALFGNDQFGDIFLFSLFIVVLIPVQKRYQIGVSSSSHPGFSGTSR